MTVKAKKRSADQEDELDALWSSAFSASSGRSDPKPKLPKTAATQPRGSPRDKNVAQRSQILGASQHTLLRCKQLKDALESDQLVMSITPKKIQAVLDNIASRMAEKYIEVYAADYNADSVGHQTQVGHCRNPSRNRNRNRNRQTQRRSLQLSASRYHLPFTEFFAVYRIPYTGYRVPLPLPLPSPLPLLTQAVT